MIFLLLIHVVIIFFVNRINATQIFNHYISYCRIFASSSVQKFNEIKLNNNKPCQYLSVVELKTQLYHISNLVRNAPHLCSYFIVLHPYRTWWSLLLRSCSQCMALTGRESMECVVLVLTPCSPKWTSTWQLWLPARGTPTPRPLKSLPSTSVRTQKCLQGSSRVLRMFISKFMISYEFVILYMDLCLQCLLHCLIIYSYKIVCVSATQF